MILTDTTNPTSGTWVTPVVSTEPAGYDQEQAELFAAMPPITRSCVLVYDRSRDQPVPEPAAQHVRGRHLHVVPDPPD